MRRGRGHRLAAQTALVRRPFLEALRPGEQPPITAWSQERTAHRERLEHLGVDFTEPDRCACGNKAIWKWKARGFCRKCRPENERFV